jgi:hypothetical protein
MTRIFDRDTRRLAAYDAAPLGELLTVLLRQWRRPLARHGITYTDAEAAALGEAIARRDDDPRFPGLKAALAALLAESEAALAAWGQTYASSLAAPMDAIPGWESTAEFLDVAERKANAELRIGTGSALLAALGEKSAAGHLITLVRRGVTDLDSAIARRVLLFASGLPADDPDWLAKAQAWYDA